MVFGSPPFARRSVHSPKAFNAAVLKHPASPVISSPEYILKPPNPRFLAGFEWAHLLCHPRCDAKSDRWIRLVYDWRLRWQGIQRFAF
jgi:hypothetical protein